MRHQQRRQDDRVELGRDQQRRAAVTLHAIPERGYSSVAAIALSPEGTMLAAAIGDRGQECGVHLWDVLSGKKVKVLAGQAR